MFKIGKEVIEATGTEINKLRPTGVVLTGCLVLIAGPIVALGLGKIDKWWISAALVVALLFGLFVLGALLVVIWRDLRGKPGANGHAHQFPDAKAILSINDRAMALGIKSFDDFSKVATEICGDEITPHLKKIWPAVEDRVKAQNSSLRAIVWAGFEDDAVKKLFRDGDAQYLSYLRGIEQIEKLKLGERNFDVVVADIEFIKRMGRAGTLKRLDDWGGETDWSAQMFAEGVAHAWNDIGAHEYSVPIRWGMNDLLVRADRPQSKPLVRQNVSWAQYSLEYLIDNSDEDARICLWNWWLPTLYSIALSIRAAEIQKGKEVGGSPLELVRQLERECPPRPRHDDGDDAPIPSRHDGTETHEPPEHLRKLTAALDLIIKNKEKFFLFNDPQRMTKKIKQGPASRCWVVLGAGSMMLPAIQKEWNGWVPIVPEEGVFGWIECAAIIEKSDNVNSAREYIEHLHSDATQDKLCVCDEYRAFPASKPVLEATVEKLKNNVAKGGSGSLWQAYQLDQVMEDSFAFREGKVSMRVLPQRWWEWVGIWETFLDKAAAGDKPLRWLPK
ncbi:MAG: hypothetical protein IH983_00270 [Planctomycetes bacterium]|nr:hypothetical protein [Planctomycetota bacterium]